MNHYFGDFQHLPINKQEKSSALDLRGQKKHWLFCWHLSEGGVSGVTTIVRSWTPSTTVKSSLNFSFVLKQLKLVKSVWKHCKKPVDLCLGWRSSELQSLPNCFQSGGKNLTICNLIVTIWQSDGQTQLNVKRIGVGGTVLLTVKNGWVGVC